MTDKIQKFFAKLSKKEIDIVREMLYKIINNKVDGLQVKKLEGHTNIFRLKKGDFRIIFLKEAFFSTIISVSRRNEKTYRDF